MTQHQVGAFVAHCYTLEGIAWVKVTKDPLNVEIAFQLPKTAQLVDSEKLQAQLTDAFTFYGNMEPFPCPCGCGAFISVSPCLRQSGVLTENELNAFEKQLVEKGNKIAAIKEYRQRIYNAHAATGKYASDKIPYPSLKESKDLVDAYALQIKGQEKVII